MGLSTVMASTIVFYVLLVLLGFIAGFSVRALLAINHAYTEAIDLSMLDRISFDSLAYNNTYPYSTIWVNLTNTGPTYIYDYRDFDVIVSYTDLTQGQRVYYARYRGAYTYTSPLTPGWYVKAFYDVTGGETLYTNTSQVLWKPNTTMELVIVLPGIVEEYTKVTITIATPHGGYTYIEFTWT